MKRLVVFLLVALSIVVMVDGDAVLAQTGGPPERVIVVLRENTPDPGAVADEHRQQHGAQVQHVYRFALKGYSATLPSQARAAVARDPRVKFISEDRDVRASDTIPNGVNRIDAEIATGSNFAPPPPFAVAVLDTGVNLSHPDLNVVSGTSCIAGQTVEDGNGHGTHVAGTIGARNNGSGVVGVVPGIELRAVKVLGNDGSGTWSTVICGVDYVTANAATIKVANMSLGGSGADDGNCGNTNSDALHQAICSSIAAGVTYVVAAGNDGANMAGFVPAAYDKVIAVTALADYDGRPGGLSEMPLDCFFEYILYGEDDVFASFSNYATAPDQGHTVGAPGVCILSTAPGGGTASMSGTSMSGTSMAGPHAAGVAALYLASHPGATPAAVLAGLRTTGEGPGANTHTDPSGLHPEPVVKANAAYGGGAPPATPDFSVACTPSSLSIAQGGSGMSSCTITSLGGFSSAVNLSCTGLPGGVFCSFNPASVTPSPNGTANSALTVNVGAGQATGTYPVQVQGTSGSVVRTASLTLNVTSGAQPCTAPVLSGTDTNANRGGKVSITWNAIAGATAYQMQQRDVGATNWTTVTTTSGTSWSGNEPRERVYRVAVAAGTCGPLPGPFSAEYNP